MDLPSVGSRIALAGQLGTIKYVGSVDGTTGTWLGVEWDDPARGKHDGVKDGKRYFTCWNRNAGSFIRPSAKLCRGMSFLEALVAKYVEALHGPDSQETVVLGSSNGAIVVEAVRLDKIRGKLANLRQLRMVSLDNQCLGKCNPPGAIQDTCPNLQGIDLSMNLLPSWDVVAAIGRELHALQRLALNRNRLQPPTDDTSLASAFTNLTELQLNETMMTWSEAQRIAVFMPRLRVLEMGYNHLTKLCGVSEQLPSNTSIETINLDSNACAEWSDIWNAMSKIRSLRHIILTSNGLGAIPFPETPRQKLQTVKQVSLSTNKLNGWMDVDALRCWFPNLEALSLIDNPLTDLERHARPFIISRIPSLLILDGAAISSKERTDAELFFISYVMRNGPESEAERIAIYPRWMELCEKHGRPEGKPKRSFNSNKLSNALLTLNVTPFRPPETRSAAEPFLHCRVLPAMTVRMLRMKIRKMLKSDGNIQLWIRMQDGRLVDLDSTQDQSTLEWLGLEEGSNIVFGIDDNK